jgi:hypothetical protein
MTVEEALALMGPSRTPLDRLVRFTCEQLADVITTFRALNQRMDLHEVEVARLAAEIAQLRAEQGRGVAGEGRETLVRPDLPQCLLARFRRTVLCGKARVWSPPRRTSAGAFQDWP